MKKEMSYCMWKDFSDQCLYREEEELPEDFFVNKKQGKKIVKRDSVTSFTFSYCLDEICREFPQSALEVTKAPC